MRGIDIYHGDSVNESSKLKTVPEKAYKESDFVIVKATQGTSYKYTSFFYKMIDRTLKDGKLAGAYHYAEGNDPVDEADYFLSVVKKYIGKAILCLDWEGGQNAKFGSKTWCTKFINRVKEKAGVTCFLYTGEDGCNQNLSLVGKVPLWFAGYPKPQATGWTVPKWKYNLGKWGKPTIWQYTSTNEKCDRNTTALTKQQWLNYAKEKAVKQTVTKDIAGRTEQELREDVVNALIMLIGVKEGSAEHKMILDRFNASGLCPRYKMTTKDAWCATTVSFAFIINKLAGKPGSGALFQCVECSCAKMIELAKKQGIWVEDDSYVPKMGDVIMYVWNDSGKGDCKGTPNHTGLTITVTNGVIKVVEGNKDDAVGYRNVKVNGKYIRGYIVPKYSQYAVKSTTTAQKPSLPKTGISYYPKYKGSSVSIVDALKTVGEKDTSLSNRVKIAHANGIGQYTGTASQNSTLLTLLKSGKLKKK